MSNGGQSCETMPPYRARRPVLNRKPINISRCIEYRPSLERRRVVGIFKYFSPRGYEEFCRVGYKSKHNIITPI